MRLPPLTFVSVLGLLVAVVSYGCSQKTVEHTVRKVTPETVDVATDKTKRVAEVAEATVKASETKNAAKTREHDVGRAEFKQKLATKLEQFDRQLEEIRMKVAKLGENAHAEWDEKVADLVAKRDAVGERIDEAMKATNEAWETLQERVHDAWGELEKAAAKAEAEL